MRFKMKRDRHSDGRILWAGCEKGDVLDYAEAERVQRGDLMPFLPFTYEKKPKTYEFSYRVGKCASLAETMKEPFTGAQLQSMLVSLLDMVRACEENGLSRRRVVFEASYVFWEPAMKALRFVYVPMRAYTATTREAEMLICLCEAASFPESDDSLVSAVLDYARRTPVLTSVSFEEFLRGQGLLESDHPTGFAFEPSVATDALDGRTVFGWDFVQTRQPTSSNSTNGVGSTDVLITRMSDGSSFILSNGTYTIGSSADCSITLAGIVGLSRRHASITVNGAACAIRDLNSTNGVYVNNRRIDPATEYPLHKGDCIILGREEFTIASA